MELTSLYLDMEDKNVLIVGMGSVGIRRTKRFLETKSNVHIVSTHIDKELKDEFSSQGAKFYDRSHIDELIEIADVVIVATNDTEFNREVSIKAKDKLVNCADNPSLSNVIFPSTFKIGSVTMSLYTGSKSPLIARELRKKIQSVITPEDLLNIELQEYARELLKDYVPDHVKRKEYMVQINNDEYIQSLIKENQLDKAKVEVKNFVTTLK